VWSAYDSDLDRKVAIKLMHRIDEHGAKRRDQLVEAQAMAKIRHPNVVTIYDVGTHESHLYIAMEFVEGSTLRAWTRETKRTPSELLDAYMAAARGLAAAHAAGVVHRDFKPDNVLVDCEGRVRVADFGLATSLAPRADVERRTSGTPAYMSPEHYAGTVDARSDQFSFCVALCEGLTGQRPFGGTTLAELATATIRAAVEPRVLGLLPARVRAVVMRGLAARPAQRHESMNALLDALHRARRPRWPWLVGAAATASLVGVGLALAGPSPGREACPEGADRVAEVWTPQDRDRIRTAPGEYSPQHASLVTAHLGAQLDLYATQWTEVHDRVCAATRSSEGAAAPTDVARRVCIEDRFAVFAGMTELVRTREVGVDAVEQLVAALPEPTECEREDIAAWEPVPSDPELATRVAVIRARLHDASLRLLAGEVEQADADARGALDAARATGFPHVIATALVVVSGFEDALGRPERARRLIDEATELALAAGHDWLVATIAVGRLEHRARYPSDDRGDDSWGLLARGLIERSGGDDRLVGRLHTAWAGIAFNRGDFADAFAHQKSAIASYERTRPAPRRLIGTLHLEAAVALAQLQRREEATDYATRGQHILDASGEPGARDVVRMLHLFALLEATLGRPKVALPHFDAAVAQAQATFGPRSRTTSMITFNRALALANCGRVADARASLRESREAWRATDDDYSAAEFEIAEHAIDLSAGDTAGALAHIDRAIELWSVNVDANARQLANAQHVRAQALLALGEHDAVLAAHEATYRRWGSELFASPEIFLDPALAAHARRDDDLLALWLARSEAAIGRGDEGIGLQTFLRALASRTPDPATIRAVQDARERYASAHFEAHPRVRQMDAWLAASAAGEPPAP
jgi:tetratricopeptide (TPR) repeat protein